ncbi:hypothetical protein LSTR_LSTR004933 [Laodelphax striatellus]|uniref:Uncharacterized protein n=1 Tax=Laodelphax striatellus TaxID=195883 RepID=A0A482XNQ3_LAOST|nr:hypothetical protein LSTR_LSTR004933 [Laodelphax striatellus]
MTENICHHHARFQNLKTHPPPPLPAPPPAPPPPPQVMELHFLGKALSESEGECLSSKKGDLSRKWNRNSKAEKNHKIAF